jgi:putative hydrolase of the HAD superfamily
MSRSGPRAVVFDFFGTLTPATSAAAWLANVDRVAAALDVPADDVHRAFDETADDRAVGAYGDLAATMRVIADRLGLAGADDRVAAACAERRAALLDLFQPRAGAIETLAAIRDRGLAIGVLSDCTTELVEAWPDLPYARYVHAPVFSCVEGRTKPDRGLFEDVAARLSARPAECVYVGDGGSDELAGATAAGMTAVLLDAPDRGAGPSRHADSWAGPRVAALQDVLALLDD